VTAIVLVTVATLTSLGLVPTGRVARADTGPAETQAATERDAVARALFDEGLLHADARRWPQAADRFERAYALRPTPEIGYNLASARIRMGQLVRGCDGLRQVETDAAATAAVRQAAAALRAETEARLGYVTVRAAPREALGRYRLAFDGQPLAPELIGRAFAVDPGIHVVEARLAADRGPAPVPLTRHARVKEAGRVELALDLPPPPVADLTSEARPAGRRGWLWAAAGAVLVGSVTAAVLLSRGDRAPTGNVATWKVGPPP
jgi:hypothetical protein